MFYSPMQSPESMSMPECHQCFGTTAAFGERCGVRADPMALFAHDAAAGRAAGLLAAVAPDCSLVPAFGRLR